MIKNNSRIFMQLNRISSNSNRAPNHNKASLVEDEDHLLFPACEKNPESERLPESPLSPPRHTTDFIPTGNSTSSSSATPKSTIVSFSTSIAIDQKHREILLNFIRKNPDIENKDILATSLTSSGSCVFDLNDLNALEKSAHQHKDTKIRLIVQSYKIQILKKLTADLKKQETGTEEPAEVVKKENKFFRWMKNTSFGSLLISGLCLDGVGNFISTQNLIKGILLVVAAPVITPVVLTTAFVFTIVNSFLFLSFEVHMLKEAMGIDSRSDIKKCLDLDAEEKKHIKTVQGQLKKLAQNVDQNQLEQFNSINEACNKLMKFKKQFYTAQLTKNNKLQNIKNAVCLALGSITTIAGSYFWATTLIHFFTTFFLLSNPVGWTITGVAMFTSLAFFLAMRGKSTIKGSNPEIEQYEKLQKKISEWKEKPALKNNFIIQESTLEKSEELKIELSELEEKERLKIELSESNEFNQIQSETLKSMIPARI
jgi:hypothetical protein